MTTENDVIPEEQETGLAIDTMESDYDEGDDLETDKVTEVSADPQATWKHNAGEIYKHTSSAIDELLSNSITAVLRAQRMFGVWDASVIARIVEKRENEVYLEIRDEGIGMTESFIDEVLSTIGLTTGSVGEDVNSSFGRGFFAGYMLVGDEKDDGSGAFLLSTNPRVTETDPDHEPPHNIICQPGRFPWKDHEASLDKDEYGTRLKFPIRDGITADDLEHWIRDYAENARLPIMLERYHPDGSVENDEIGGNNLEETYPDDSPAVVVEQDGLYRAVTSPDAAGKAVILDTRTTTNGSLVFPLYNWWNVDIRLLNEGGAIYDSPDEWKIGKTPISEEDYEKVPDNKKDEYILKSEVDQYNDKRLPQPSGTRDVIELPNEFRTHVFEKLKEKTKEQVQTAVDALDTPDDWDDLDAEHANMLGSIITKRKHKWNLNSADDDTLELLQTFSKSVDLVARGATIADRHNISHRNRSSKRIYELYQEYDRVFFGQSILQRRANAVWDASEDYAVVQVGTDMYDALEEIGWERITKIRSTTVDDLDVSDEIVEQFKSARSRPSSGDSGYEGVASDYDDRTVKLHRDTYAKTTEVSVGNIRAHFGDDVDEYDDTLPNSIGRVVLFTSTSEFKISNHKDLVDPYTATATCVNRVYEENLAHLDNVIKFEEYDNHNLDYSLLTEDGTLPAEDVLGRELNPIHVTDQQKQRIQALDEEVDWNLLASLEPDKDGLTILTTDADIYAIRPHLSDLSEPTRNRFSSLSTRNIQKVPFQFEYGGRQTAWRKIAYARLPEWRDEDVVEAQSFIRNTYGDSNKWDMLDRIGALHDSDAELSSATDAGFGDDGDETITLETSAGERSMEDIRDSEKELVVFPITDEVEPLFDDISPAVVKAYLAEHGDTPRYGNYVAYENTDTYLVSVETYDRAQRLTRDYDVRIARPKNAPTVGNAHTSNEPLSTYTPLYAYYKARETDVDYANLRPFTKHTLVDTGYHTVNTMVKSFTLDDE